MNLEIETVIEFVMTIKNNLKVEVEIDQIELITDYQDIQHMDNKTILEA